MEPFVNDPPTPPVHPPTPPVPPPAPPVHPPAATGLLPLAPFPGGALVAFPGADAATVAAAHGMGEVEQKVQKSYWEEQSRDLIVELDKEERPEAVDGLSPTNADAVALARVLLPTVPHPAIEYNLPVLDVQRSQVDDVENIERVDWATIQIVETHDEEGRIDLMSESQMCELLGLTDEVTTNVPAQGFDCRMDEEGNDKENTDGAAIPTSDAIPCELVISYDKNNPSMEVGTLYPTMDEFKLAVRQFAINNEFNLGVEKSCKTRYTVLAK